MGEKQFRDDMIAEVNLYEDALYFVSDGQLKPVDHLQQGSENRRLADRMGNLLIVRLSILKGFNFDLYKNDIDHLYVFLRGDFFVGYLC
ncbi:hypothetical protein MKZ08_16445 [Viridibacillus sp. FSL R5-0477]|uniref:Uncharacterized protein n=1 Tax=Viridibacillus arenosi FSL R5-213 TaxID=1227360 RepID=W4F1L0_9BACL|nr:hypothetical protein [Viridibacillus arenosi]ETT85951.1 hypothetical protein C176_10982 [Viridibacillus arenosi FSL R5-213]OMC93351.1 hypothetical protein BK137_02215 [Viridibacillus arenosi]